MPDYLKFSDIYGEIEKVIKHFDSSMTAMVKNIANMVYLNELMVADDLYPLFWMVDFDDTLAAVEPRTITGITVADPGVITCDDDHGLTTNDIVSVYDIVGTMSVLNNRAFLINSAPATDTLSLIDLNSVDAIDTTGLAYTSGGTIVHRGLKLATTGKDVQRILEAGWHDEDKMVEITFQELEEETKWWNDATARPERYRHRKQFSTAGAEANMLLWFPGSDDAYDLRYWFEKRATPLSNDADVPLLPPQFHHAIVAGAVTRLAESKVQVENAVVWPGIYKAQIQALVNFNRRYYEEHEAVKREKPYLL